MSSDYDEMGYVFLPRKFTASTGISPLKYAVQALFTSVEELAVQQYG